jgi:L-rhamnose mutarotase
MKKMYHHVFNVAILFTTVFVTGCTENNVKIKPAQQFEERVFVVNIVPDSARLKEYLDYHKNIWPEVEAGFKKAGYQKIILYRYGRLLVMTITVPSGADLSAMGKLAESYDPRCAEWNKLMDTYQEGIEGTPRGQTWVEAKPFYRFNKP